MKGCFLWCAQEMEVVIVASQFNESVSLMMIMMMIRPTKNMNKYKMKIILITSNNRYHFELPNKLFCPFNSIIFDDKNSQKLSIRALFSLAQQLQ